MEMHENNLLLLIVEIKDGEICGPWKYGIFFYNAQHIYHALETLPGLSRLEGQEQEEEHNFRQQHRKHASTGVAHDRSQPPASCCR